MATRKLGNRSDGTLVDELDPLFTLMPYLLKTRTGSQVFFDFELPLSNIEYIVKKYRAMGVRLSIMDVIVAALVRLYANNPTVHRFVIGKKIYKKNHIEIAMMVKKEMTAAAPEAAIKLTFLPTDTLIDVHNKLQGLIAENKGLSTENDTEVFEKAISFVPVFLRSAIMNTILFLDDHGFLPSKIIALSPFHTSVYISNVGSLGMQPVKHHLYDVGTASMFMTFGAKYKKIVSDKNGGFHEEKYIAMSFTVDERVCDGYNLSRGFKSFQRYLLHPEVLEAAQSSIPSSAVPCMN